MVAFRQDRCSLSIRLAGLSLMSTFWPKRYMSRVAKFPDRSVNDVIVLWFREIGTGFEKLADRAHNCWKSPRLPFLYYNLMSVYIRLLLQVAPGSNNRQQCDSDRHPFLPVEGPAICSIQNDPSGIKNSIRDDHFIP